MNSIITIKLKAVSRLQKEVALAAVYLWDTQHD